jgi:hypothetical protein
MRAVVGLASVAWLGCSFDWDSFDPRVVDASATSAQATTSATGGSTTSAGGSGAAGGSAGGGGGGGGALGPWGPPQLVTALSHAADDDDPTFTADLLELYFNTERGTDPDIWKSTRASSSDAWGPPVEEAALNSLQIETQPMIAPDGLTIWLSSDRAGQGLTDIFISTRATRTSPWSTPTLVVELSSPSYENASTVINGALFMLMDRNDQIHTTSRNMPSDPWGPVTPIAELNVSPINADGWLAPDSLTLIFTSDRAGDPHLYETVRTTPDGVFAMPVSIAELNSTGPDSDPFLSPDARYIMFARGLSLNGPRELYEASR